MYSERISRLGPTLTMVAVALTVVPGCATTWRAEALEARTQKLEKSRAQLTADLRREQKRLRRLHDEIEKSTHLLRHSGAQISARLDRFEQLLKKVGGELELLDHKLKRPSATLHDVLQRGMVPNRMLYM